MTTAIYDGWQVSGNLFLRRTLGLEPDVSTVDIWVDDWPAVVLSRGTGADEFDRTEVSQRGILHEEGSLLISDPDSPDLLVRGLHLTGTEKANADSPRGVVTITLTDDRAFWGNRGWLDRWHFNVRRDDGTIAPETMFADEGQPAGLSRRGMLKYILSRLPFSPTLNHTPFGWGDVDPADDTTWVSMEFEPFVRAKDALRIFLARYPARVSLDWDRGVSFWDPNTGRVGHGDSYENENELPGFTEGLDGRGHTVGTTFDRRTKFILVVGGQRIRTVETVMEPVVDVGGNYLPLSVGLATLRLRMIQAEEGERLTWHHLTEEEWELNKFDARPDVLADGYAVYHDNDKAAHGFRLYPSLTPKEMLAVQEEVLKQPVQASENLFTKAIRRDAYRLFRVGHSAAHVTMYAGIKALMDAQARDEAKRQGFRVDPAVGDEILPDPFDEDDVSVATSFLPMRRRAETDTLGRRLPPVCYARFFTKVKAPIAVVGPWGITTAHGGLPPPGTLVPAELRTKEHEVNRAESELANLRDKITGITTAEILGSTSDTLLPDASLLENNDGFLRNFQLFGGLFGEGKILSEEWQRYNDRMANVDPAVLKNQWAPKANEKLRYARAGFAYMMRQTSGFGQNTQDFREAAVDGLGQLYPILVADNPTNISAGSYELAHGGVSLQQAKANYVQALERRNILVPYHAETFKLGEKLIEIGELIKGGTTLPVNAAREAAILAGRLLKNERIRVAQGRATGQIWPMADFFRNTLLEPTHDFEVVDAGQGVVRFNRLVGHLDRTDVWSTSGRRLVPHTPTIRFGSARRAGVSREPEQGQAGFRDVGDAGALPVLAADDLVGTFHRFFEVIDVGGGEFDLEMVPRSRVNAFHENQMQVAYLKGATELEEFPSTRLVRNAAARVVETNVPELEQRARAAAVALMKQNVRETTARFAFPAPFAVHCNGRVTGVEISLREEGIGFRTLVVQGEEFAPLEAPDKPREGHRHRVDRSRQESLSYRTDRTGEDDRDLA